MRRNNELQELDIWQLAREIVIDIHKMTMNELPKFEMFEEGSQIRRSSKSVKSAIVEGYGRREYKQDFIRFLTIALASNDETIDHLENLYETGSLEDQRVFKDLHHRIDALGKKINRFIRKVETSHLSKNETIINPGSSIEHLEPKYLSNGINSSKLENRK